MTMLATTLRMSKRYDTIVAGLVRLTRVLSRYAHGTAARHHAAKSAAKRAKLEREKKLEQ